MALEHDECAFCRIIAGQEEARIVWRSADMIAMLPLEPATRGHTLVVPVAHAQTIFDLDESAIQQLAVATQRVAVGVTAAFSPDGLNLIQSNGRAATQTVRHVHVHVLPRWANDEVIDPWPRNVSWSPADLDGIADLVRTALEDET